MGQELKELLKPPFIPSNQGVVLNSLREPILITSESKIERENEKVSEFIAAAMNEKYERDYSEPLRWTRICWGTYKCPKCKVTQDEGDLTSYCPHCGQKLDPPENTNVS